MFHPSISSDLRYFPLLLATFVLVLAVNTHPSTSINGNFGKGRHDDMGVVQKGPSRL